MLVAGRRQRSLSSTPLPRPPPGRHRACATRRRATPAASRVWGSRRRARAGADRHGPHHGAEARRRRSHHALDPRRRCRAISSLVATLVQAAPRIAISRDTNRTLPKGYGRVHVSTRDHAARHHQLGTETSSRELRRTSNPGLPLEFSGDRDRWRFRQAEISPAQGRGVTSEHYPGPFGHESVSRCVSARLRSRSR